MMRGDHPIHLVTGLTLWFAWFLAIYATLSVGCAVAPPPVATGALTWINAAIVLMTVAMVLLLGTLALRCWRGRLRPKRAHALHVSWRGYRPQPIWWLPSLLWWLDCPPWPCRHAPDTPGQSAGTGAEPRAPCPGPQPARGELEERLAGLLTALLLLGFWLVYSLGARRVRTARWRQVLFHATALLSVLALLGPLDDWAKTSTAAHMAQHMLLMVVIAPLWVFSRPLPALSAMTRRIGPFLWTPLLRLTARPITCAWLHGLAIWFWHLPLFYMAAVENPGGMRWNTPVFCSQRCCSGGPYFAPVSGMPLGAAGAAAYPHAHGLSRGGADLCRHPAL